MSAEPEQPEIIRLQRCPQCAYDLAGLPRQGRCPECGFQYESSMFSLLGSPSASYWWLTSLAYLMIIAFNLFSSGAYFVGSIVAFAIVIAVGTWIGRRRAKRGECWMLFTNEGVASQHSPGNFSVIPWSAIHRVQFHRVMSRNRKQALPRWRIRLHREPNAFVFKRRDALFREFGREIRLDLVASEEDARCVVNELRARFSRGWERNLKRVAGAPAVEPN